MGSGWARVGSLARPSGGSSRSWRAGLRLGGGPWRRGPHPPWTLSSWDFPGGDTPRQVGDRPWLEREKCPEKRTVPVGSGDVCSTVHGSYQLSTDLPPPPSNPTHDRQPPGPAPAAHMHADQAAPPDHSLPLGTWSWLVPIHPPIKPKENKLFKKIHTLKSYTRFRAK